MIALIDEIEGIRLPVKAHAGARRNAITGEHAGQLKVSVTQAPERGKANDAIVDILCSTLSLHRNQITLLSGETNPAKVFRISDISLAQLQTRLNAVLLK